MTSSARSESAATATSSLKGLDAALSDGQVTAAAFRAVLDQGSADLKARFQAGEPVENLVRQRAELVDAVLVRAFRMHATPGWEELALLAVGGYGRGELHPGSDVDICILTPEEDPGPVRTALEAFLAFLWDIGLEIGHSIRNVARSKQEASGDITIATALMEARLLAGPTPLYAALQKAVGPDSIWPSREFFTAKLKEQEARHHRYHDTAYNLEPNVKGSPGGLRDIQMIGWVAQRHFGAASLHEVVDHGFLTPEEYDSLIEGRAFLWKVRFALHSLTGRREDRLLFDHQANLAGMFGYEDSSFTLAVEQLMQRYYRTVLELSRLNEMLLQMLHEAILPQDKAPQLHINERFRIRNGYLEITNPDVFAQQPSALLELFLHVQEHYDELSGVSADTIRAVRRNLHRVDEEFRQDPRHHRMFIALLRAPRGVTHELRRMNRYGILGRYIPAFGRIVGRMQYDLFHAYTVDAHTLFVISNLRRFALQRYNDEFPFCSQVMQSLQHPELAYLGALFHDIAKGRGGDHSQLGAVDAEAFCLEHGLSQQHAELVAWLVSNHLLLSLTAQKKDISDPQVIHDFAVSVGDETRLDYLYVLTVADVRGTNPSLWNSWRSSLFESLYVQTRQALSRGLENPIEREELIAETRATARDLLLARGLDDARIDETWNDFADEYFLQHTGDEIAWHVGLLADRTTDTDDTLIAIRRQDENGGSAVLVYAPYARHNFAVVTAVLDQMGLNVVIARIAAAASGHSLDTYSVLDHAGAPIPDEHRAREIENALRSALLKGSEPRVTRRAPRQVRMFDTETSIGFANEARNARTVMELVTGDRPGILLVVAQVFRQLDISLQAARITTIGERAEDVFYITDAAGEPLTEALRQQLAEQLRIKLERQNA